VAIVTGEQRIGFAIAEGLAFAGAINVIADIAVEREGKQKIEAWVQGQIDSSRCDEKGFCRNLVSQVLKDFKQIDIW
jgi:NAD(P)-dependent dehydrogenase (short-subunit alcohol dehydrogenase family)